MDVLEMFARIEAKLDRLLNGPEKDSLSVADAMKLTGDRSRSAFYRTCELLNVRPYKFGLYRRTDLQNAIARRSYENQLRANRLAAEAEKHTEARRHLSIPKRNQ